MVGGRWGVGGATVNHMLQGGNSVGRQRVKYARSPPVWGWFRHVRIHPYAAPVQSPPVEGMEANRCPAPGVVVGKGMPGNAAIGGHAVSCQGGR